MANSDFKDFLQTYGQRRRNARWFKTGTGIFALAVWNAAYAQGFEDGQKAPSATNFGVQRYIVSKKC